MELLTELTNFLGEHIFGVHWRTTPNAVGKENGLRRAASVLLEGGHTRFGLVKAVEAAPEAAPEAEKKAETKKTEKKSKKKE